MIDHETSATGPDSSRPGRKIPILPLQALIGFSAAVAAVLVMAFFSFQASETRSSSAEQVTRTLQIMEGISTLLSKIKDAETGQRGFILTGDETYLSPYIAARAEVTGQIDRLRGLTTDSEQLQRLQAVERLSAEKMAELNETVEMRRSGRIEAAVAMIRTDRGKAAMDRVRELTNEMHASAQQALTMRQQEWEAARRSSIWVTAGGSAILLLLIGSAALLASRDFYAREMQVWLRTGQMGFALKIQGDQRLDDLGKNALEYLTRYLSAPVGAIYIAEGRGRFRRFAGYALGDEVMKEGTNLLGQAARENRLIHITNVPEDFLPVTSTLGQGKPREVLLAPAATDGIVQAVVELGFLRQVTDSDRELVMRLMEALGVAVRASKDRTRLEELLEETQRQSEELQTQQEELRTTNEELEVQTRALKESKGQLESQQAELEQVNSHLEEQTQSLENQKEELTRSQSVLAESNAALEKANQYKSEFLANMSHELRTPLNSSLILAKLLADNKAGNLTDDQVKFANTILSAGNDLLAIINDVLDLSKIEAGKVELSLETVSVKRIVDSLTASFQPMALQKGLKFEVSLDDSFPESIETDSQRIAQILKNLLGNAIKFTERGKIGLRVFAPQKNTVCFAVSDTGIGIPDHQHQIIFEAFRQADGSTHRRYGGTGLGLSISRDLAHLLGGDIEVNSVPNQGSTFTLRVPLVREPDSVQIKPTVSTALPDPAVRVGRAPAEERPTTLPSIEIADDRHSIVPGSRFILVIEDDVRFAAILRDLSHERGFQCVVTHSANDGLAAARKWKPSAILLDINLPDHSGLGVLDQLKRDPHTRHIPVHVASVVDFAQEALGLGAVGYALKPVKREQLVEAFQRLEEKFSQRLRHVLIVEDDARQRESIRQLLASDDVEIVAVENAGDALKKLQTATFDCMVMDLNLPDLSGYALLKKMAEEEHVQFPPVIIYTGRSLTSEEEQQLGRFSKSIIIKDARSPERLLDEVTLFLHQVEEKLPEDRQRMLRLARDRESVFENRRILIVEDDVRNIFALTSLLEPKGARLEIARNGREAIESLERRKADGSDAIDLVLMDIMMPEMDGLTAMRKIRTNPQWKRLPIIALTAKAMRDDQENCLSAGANDYIAKPLDVEKLLSLMRVWMPK